MLSESAIVSLRQHRARQAEGRLALGGAWEDLDLVFPNKVGRFMDGGHLLKRSLRPILKQTGLPPVRFHDLRHTAATLLVDPRGPLQGGE